MSISFVHLNVHSEFSIDDGIIKPHLLPLEIKNRGMPAVALTDLNNCSGVIKFYQNAINQGIKPIIGCELCLESLSNIASADHSRLILLACDYEYGYRNLFKLISMAWRDMNDWPDYRPRLRYDWLNKESTAGLIALSGAQSGDLGLLLQQDEKSASTQLNYWMQLFDDRFYIELRRTGATAEEQYIESALSLAAKHDCPVVATNASGFCNKGDYTAHEARVRISKKQVLGDDNPSVFTEEQYLKSQTEMELIFKDIPEALANSVEIAKRCNVEIDLDRTRLPKYPYLEQGITAEQFLEKEAQAGLIERMLDKPHNISEESYQARLQIELKVIAEAGFADYFLIVMDFVHWALEHDVPVGPGRGSGAGSVVAWALKITDIDPLKYGLLFERFLNKERIGLPDFDIDFCMINRDKVMDYVRKQYGNDKVAAIATFNRMAGRAAVRYAANVLGKPLVLADRLAKAMPGTIGMSMTDMLKEDEKTGAISDLSTMLREDAETQEIWDLALTLEGLVHNIARHAGGMVIAPDNLMFYTPLHYGDSAESETLSCFTQLDKDDIEQVGLVKFDFLGLRTLTVLDKAEKAINKAQSGEERDILDLSKIALDDRAVYKSLCEGKTRSLFQLESDGMRQLLLRYQPKVFEDLIVLLSLYRPGPLKMNMHTDYVERRSGNKAVDYYGVPVLEPVLKDTYGVFLYQEQVMECARVMAGYSLGEADVLRHAMGKKKEKEMERQREKFVRGAKQNDLAERTAHLVFDVMEKFSGYGFNKSHATAYAMIAYRTAWLKVHYSPWYMAAEMSTLMSNTDALDLLIKECRDLKITIDLPCVNRSGSEFEVDNEGCLRYALSAIKSIGVGVAECIVAERSKNGAFKNMLDFCCRMDVTINCNHAVLRALVYAGCFDTLHPEYSRAQLDAAIDYAVSALEEHKRFQLNQSQSMFDNGADTTDAVDMKAIVAHSGDIKWSKRVQLENEQRALGFYLNGHPLEDYQKLLSARQCVRLNAIKDSLRCTIAGSVSKITKIKRNTIIVVELNDGTATVDVMLDDKMYQSYRGIIKKYCLLIVQGTIRSNQFSEEEQYRCRPKKIELIDDIVKAHVTQSTNRQDSAINASSLLRYKCIALRISAHECKEHKVIRLKSLLESCAVGYCRVEIIYVKDDTETILDLPYKININHGDSLLTELRALWGADAIIADTEPVAKSA